jgi:hypothetical protein
MCGGHEFHHLIQTLTTDSTAYPTDVTEEIKLMYARGHIDIETFKRLIPAAKQGYLSHEDVLRITNGAQSGKTAPQAERETDLHSSSLDANGPLQDLEKRLARLRTQAEDAEVAARRLGLAEQQVRAYLETKQGALFRAEAVQKEIAALQGNNHKSAA